MTPEEITLVMRETLFTAFQIAAPFLLTALIVGLLVSLFQSMTQMQEMTLTFVPKMFAIAALLLILFPWILKIMTKYTTHLITDQWEKVVTFVNYVY